MRLLPKYMMVLLACLGPSLAFAEQSALEQAYEQEMELLQREKEALLARVAEAEAAAREEAEELRLEVGDLSEQLTRMRTENEVLDERLALEESLGTTDADRRALLESVLDQARATTASHGVEVGAPP
ncbi:MAG: hypothetical protein ACOCVR_03115, partial [Myxococcota bacterium]